MKYFLVIVLLLAGGVSADEPAAPTRDQVVIKLVRKLFSEATLRQNQAVIAQNVAMLSATHESRKVELLDKASDLRDEANTILDKLSEAICLELDPRAPKADKDQAWKTALTAAERKN